MRGRFKGNPNWGRALNLSELPVAPTAFEVISERLGLKTERQQQSSRQLRDWAKRHYKTRYVPESLIVRWGLSDRFELENLGL
jgi:hypothetical protein